MTRYGYLYIVACALPLSLYVQSWDLASSPLGPPWSALIVLLLVIVALLAWASAPTPERHSAALTTFIALAFVAWCLSAAFAISRHDLFNATFLATPAILLMVAIKPPPLAESLRVLDVFAVAVLAVTVATFALQAVDLGPGRWEGFCGDSERLLGTCSTLSDGGSYRIPLGPWLGLGVRSAGPFNHPNALGQMMAILVAYGVSRWGVRWRWLIPPVALVLLLLSGSRAGLVGAIAGTTAVIALKPAWAPLGLSRPWRMGIAAAVLGLGAGFWVAINPGLTGRVSMWPQMIDVWRTSPWTGVGQVGLFDAIADGRLPGWASGGHNLFIDELARNGVISAAVTVAALTVVVVISFREAWLGMTSAVAIAVAFVVTGLADDTLDWMHPTVLTFPLLIGMAAASAGRLRPTPTG